MSRFMSAEEVRLDHLAKMGSDLGPVFNAIHNEVGWLYVKWDQYRALFGTKPGRIDLLNEGAPLFFHIMQDEGEIGETHSLRGTLHVVKDQEGFLERFLGIITCNTLYASQMP